jgi:hypothetical protein
VSFCFPPAIGEAFRCGDASVPDSDGIVSLVVPRSIAYGYYLRILAPAGDAGDTFDTVLYYPGMPLVGARADLGINWVSPAALRGAASIVQGSAQNVDLGMVLAGIGDCVGSADTVDSFVPAVMMTLSESADPIYFAGRVPDTQQKKGQWGLFFNVAAGDRVFRATDPNEKKIVSQIVAVEPGALTIVYANYPVWAY